MCLTALLLTNLSLPLVHSVYAPQAGLCESLKDSFYDVLQTTVANFSHSETWFIGSDLNGHIGKYANSFENVHGGCGYGDRNTEGERILEFAVANNRLSATPGL